MPTVSVCIVTYNSADDIEACLNAVLAQNHPVERIVVIDNASKDGTPERVRAFADQVLFIPNEKNNGFAGGQNQAIRQTDSDYVLVLNPDVTLKPDYLSKIIAYMENNPNIGSATGKLVLASDPLLMDSAGLGMSRTKNAYDLAAGEPAVNWSTALPVFGVSGAAAVYSRRMIKDISVEGEFFDEQFFAYKEDVDVAWRAGRLGWKAHYVPEAKALHSRGWKQSGRRSIPLFVRKHSYMNRFYTLVKNESLGWHSLLLFPQIIAVEAAKLGYILLFEPALLTCLPTLWRTLPDMLRKRRLINEKMNKLAIASHE